MQELDEILDGDLINDQNRFAGVTLSEATRRLLNQDPTGEDLVLVNRMLLEVP